MPNPGWQRKILWGGQGLDMRQFGSLGLWLKADQGVIYDGSNKVSQWQDQSGNQNHFSQSTGANQPTFVNSLASLNNKPSVQFARASSFFMSAASYVNTATSHTLYCVYNGTSTTAVQDIFYTNTGPLVFAAISSTAANIGYYDGLWRQYTPAVTGSQFVSFVMTDGSTSAIRRNGALLTSSLAYTARAMSGTATLGAAIDGLSQYLDAHLSEVVLFHRALGSAERTVIDNWFSLKYGIAM